MAVAANAPAFAASTAAPRVTSTSGCKTPGQGSNCQGYRITLGFAFEGPYTWTISFSKVTANNVDVTSSIQPVSRTFTVDATNPTLNFTICTTASDSKINLGYTYTATRAGVPSDPVVVTPYEVKFLPKSC